MIVLPLLPKPTDQLSGCVWLPRFIAKVQLHSEGRLDGDYLLAFCHPRGVDGHFLQHFGLDKQDAIKSILSAKSTGQLAEWFTSLTGVTQASISAWNDLAPRIGSPGQPSERELIFMLRRSYPNGIPAEAKRSSFEAILHEEYSSGQAGHYTLA